MLMGVATLPHSFLPHKHAKHSEPECIIKRDTVPEGIYNPITAMGFSAMFSFQLNNTKR
jgi:hypothetical protein